MTINTRSRFVAIIWVADDLPADLRIKTDRARQDFFYNKGTAPLVIRAPNHRLTANFHRLAIYLLQPPRPTRRFPRGDTAHWLPMQLLQVVGFFLLGRFDYYVQGGNHSIPEFPDPSMLPPIRSTHKCALSKLKMDREIHTHLLHVQRYAQTGSVLLLKGSHKDHKNLFHLFISLWAILTPIPKNRNLFFQKVFPNIKQRSFKQKTLGCFL